MPTKPPADGKHKVADGEWAGSIALNYGFTDWESIWNLPENDELRRNREDDAHTLAEGDVLFLPQWTQKEESGDTEQRHKFQLNTPSEVLRIRVLGENGEPLAGAQYVLDITCTPGGGARRWPTRAGRRCRAGACVHRTRSTRWRRSRPSCGRGHRS